MGSLVILTGASASGKTTLARAIQQKHRSHCEVLSFDSIGVPSNEEMKAFGSGHQPGGAWQRAMTIQWMKRIVALLRAGAPVLFEGQMRIAFIQEALAMVGIDSSHVLLVDCDDVTRADRLRTERRQPQLANNDMMAWARYLRAEAMQAGCDVMDTGVMPIEECRAHIESLLRAR
jgi:dephospho-CoA kinase